MQIKLKMLALAASTFACVSLLSFGWSEQGGISLSIESAQARVGRPGTPVSVAGVARRQTRRAVYGTAAVGAAAAAGAYGYYGSSYNQGYYSQGAYNQGYACQPGTYFRGQDGRRYLCQ